MRAICQKCYISATYGVSSKFLFGTLFIFCVLKSLLSIKIISLPQMRTRSKLKAQANSKNQAINQVFKSKSKSASSKPKSREVAQHINENQEKDMLQKSDYLFISNDQASAIKSYKQAIQQNLKKTYSIKGYGLQRYHSYYRNSPNISSWYKENIIDKGLSNPYDGLSLCIAQTLNFQEHIEWYEEMLKREPENYQLMVGLGNLFMNMMLINEQKYIEKAKKQYQNAIQIVPEIWLLYENMAKVHYFNHENVECEQSIRKALEINPEAYECHLLLATITQNNNQRQEQFLQLIRDYPTHGNTYSFLGQQFTQQQRYEEAIKTYLKGISVDKYEEDLYQGLAQAYKEKGDEDRVISILLKGIEIGPSFYDFYSDLGVAYLSQQRIKAAKKQFLKGIEIQPKYTDCYIKLSKVLIDEKEFEQAEQLLQKALQNCEQKFELIQRRGQLCQLQQEWTKALICFAICLEIDENNIPILLKSGVCYSQLGEYDEEEQCYHEILKIDPHHINAKLNLGVIYFSQGKDKKSLETYKSCLQAPKINKFDRFHIYCHIASVYHNLQRTDLVIDNLAECFKIYHEEIQDDQIFRIERTFDTIYNINDYCLNARIDIKVEDYLDLKKKFCERFQKKLFDL